MNRTLTIAVAALLVVLPTVSAAQELPPELAAFRALYQELVEINTTQSVGDCTLAAHAVAARLRAGGIPDADIRIIVPPGYPKRGNLVAILHGTDQNAEAILLLAHIDVVEANPEDWDRDPFTFVEENGYFYSRGVADDKAQAAIFADNMIRYRQEGYRPRRDIKLALTCGEETPEDYNGIRYLLENERPLIEAAFAINENGSGVLDHQGQRVAIAMQAGQKIRQRYRFELSGQGGFSSGPPRDTVIYRMGRALARLAAYDFPLNISATSRAYLEGMAALESGEDAVDMRALLREPPDPEVAARIRESDPRLNAMLRTTCVAVLLNAGEAEATLPQRASATIDCRMVPGEDLSNVHQTLIRVVDDPEIAITAFGEPGLPSPPPPLTDEILGPARQVANEMWPGIPIVPYQVNGEDDGRFLTPAGITSYGLSGIFREPGGGGSHGLNERVLVRSVYEAREFLYKVVKLYADGE